MSRFAEDAQRILEAAAAVAAGQEPGEMTVLIGREGGIHMIAGSDWPLDSLRMHHGAEAAYRVNLVRSVIRVEGRAASQRCVLESTPARSPKLSWL